MFEYIPLVISESSPNFVGSDVDARTHGCSISVEILAVPHPPIEREAPINRDTIVAQVEIAVFWVDESGIGDE